MPLTIRRHHLWGDPVLELSGRTIAGDTFKLSKCMEDLQDGAFSRVIIDLSRLKNMDSQMIGTLVFLKKSLANSAKDLLLVAPPGFIRDLLVCTRLDRVFTLLNSMKEIPSIPDSSPIHPN
jgi:anti-anti-sigma factor